MLHYLTLNTIPELICFLAAVACLRNDKNVIWRIMILFLFITCLAEITGIYVKRLNLIDKNHLHPNGWVYNILLVFQATFFSLLFYELLKKYLKVKPVIIGGLVLLMAIHIYKLGIQGFSKYDELMKTTMSIILVLYSFYFYYCLIKDDRYINLTKYPGFWLVAGILFFYFGTTTYNIFYEKLASMTNKSKTELAYLRYINSTFIILLYTCWSYSFICRRWLTPTSKSLS